MNGIQSPAVQALIVVLAWLKTVVSPVFQVPEERAVSDELVLSLMLRLVNVAPELCVFPARR